MAVVAIYAISSYAGSAMGWYVASQVAITVGQMAVISAVTTAVTSAVLTSATTSDAGGTALYGQQLTTAKSQVSTYGKAIPRVFGNIRLAGNVIWSPPFQEHATTQSGGGGGKGKKGGGGGSYTSYTYTASFAASICAGPIVGVRKIWANNELIYNLGDAASIEEIIASNATAAGIKFYLGNEAQLPDPTIESYLGSGNVPAYRGQAYVVFSDAPMERFGNRLPNLEFEVICAGGVGTSLEEHYNVAGVTYGYFTCPTYCDDYALHFIECTGTQWKDWSLPHGQAVATLVDVKTITASDSVYYYPTARGYCDERGKFMQHSGYTELRYQGYANGEFTEKVFSLHGAISVLSACKLGDDYFYSGIDPAVNNYMYAGLNGIRITSLPNIQLATGNATCGITENFLYIYHPMQNYIYRFDRTGQYIDAITNTSWWNGEWIIKFESDGIAYAINSTQVYKLDFTNLSSITKTLVFSSAAIAPLSPGNSIPSIFKIAQGNVYVGGYATYLNTTNSAIFTQNKLGKNEVPLGSVITDLVIGVGVEPFHLDTSALTDTITGYAMVNQMTARTALEQLLSYTSVGAVESGGKIKFLKRSAG